MEGDPLAPLTVPMKYSTLSALPRCELSSEDFDTICVIYRLPQKKRSYHRLIRKNIHFITHDLMASQGNWTEVFAFYSKLSRLVLIPYSLFADNFNKKMPVRLDFRTIQKMMAEAWALKTSSSSYKKQIKDLVEASKRLQPPTEEEVLEDPEEGQEEYRPSKMPNCGEANPCSEADHNSHRGDHSGEKARPN
ncbi:uncharacterized protein LOC111408937 isoform X1 [Olea europaea var. sylvestris]|uniref:uncharacterized protein LOC111408937 isoform X1 n=1 Tax=Olea europaea var. sylvestris TaxID=158386 RepID=UPI000C1D32D7|nr:uncharacterized protein LOC111408937 isoform X1 [Olea europaea var. sylvestris]